MLSYFSLLILTISVPVCQSFNSKLNYFQKWPRVLTASFLTSIPFLIWDNHFTKNQIWGFNDEYITGLKIFNLPIEEILFFLAIPFSCLFIYEVCKYYKLGKLAKLSSKNINIFLLSISILGLIFFHDLTYTAYITIATLLISLYILFSNNIFYPNFIFSFFLSLLGFFLINGILTGGLAFISQNPIVWYNNEEKLPLRIGSIPIEDIFYAYVLLLLNTIVYEKIKLRPTKKL